MLIHSTIPFALFNKLLPFRDTAKELELKGEFLKMITIKNYNVDQASLSDKKLTYDFAKELFFDVKATRKNSTRDRSLEKKYVNHHLSRLLENQ